MTTTAAPKSPTRWVDRILDEIDAALTDVERRPVIREDLCTVGRVGYRRGIREDDDVPTDLDLTTDGLAALARRAPRNAFWHVTRVA